MQDWSISATRRDRELGLFVLEKSGLGLGGGGGISSLYIKMQREGAKKTKPGPFRWCPVSTRL